jgi:hypothetical protein
MKPSLQISSFQAILSKHNIAYFYFAELVTRLPRAASEDRLTHTGNSLRLGGIGSRSSATSMDFFSGLGGAYSMSIPAAKSSARASIISFSNCMSLLRRFATLFKRMSLNSCMRPLWTVVRYSTSRRSRSSAVPGFLKLGLRFGLPSVRERRKCANSTEVLVQ